MRVDLGQSLFAATGLNKLRNSVIPVAMGRAANGIAQVAAQQGKHKIRTSPTAGDWSHFYAGNPRWKESVRKPTGRVETGAMLEDFIGRIDSSRLNHVVIEVGWVDNPQEYYGLQEFGFLWEPDVSGTGVSVWVPGMGVLESTRESIEKYAARAIDRVMAKELREFNARAASGR